MKQNKSGKKGNIKEEVKPYFTFFKEKYEKAKIALSARLALFKKERNAKSGTKNLKKTNQNLEKEYGIFEGVKKDLWLDAIISASYFFSKPLTTNTLLSYMPTTREWGKKDVVSVFSRIGLEGQLISIPFKDISLKVSKSFIFLCKDQYYFVSAFQENGDVEIIDKKGKRRIDSLKNISEGYSGYILYVESTTRGTEKGYNPFIVTKSGWFWDSFKAHIPVYLEVIVAAFLINLFALASPLFIMNVYDRVVRNAAYHTLWVLAFGMFIIIVFSLVMKKLKHDFIDMAAKRIDMRVSARTFAHILDIKMNSRLKSVGGMASIVQSFDSIRDFITSASVSVLVDFPFIFLFLFVIFWFGGSLVFIPLIAVVLSLGISLFVQTPLKRMIGEFYKEIGEKQAVLIESLASVETIKVVGAYGRFLERWNDVSAQSATLGVKVHGLSNIGLTLATTIQQIATVSVIIGGVYRITDGLMTMGALIASTILTGRTLAPVSQMAFLLTRYQQAKGAMENLNKVMELPTELNTDHPGISLREFSSKIEFRHVSFSYPDLELSVLKDVNTSIHSGDRIGIVGSPGSGKSTFLKLIMKLYDPTDGQILMDDLEIRQLNTSDLRRFIGYVPQDTVLFNTTVRENITMGAGYVSDEQLVRVATLSGLMPFIQAHPKGFDWEVGEQGKCISGGQRQAVVIARALLLDPPLLIFDEPTSDVDDTTTRQIVANLDSILPGKTLLLVTHKLNLLKLTSRLLVFSKGQLVADGPRDQVLEKLKAGGIQKSESKVIQKLGKHKTLEKTKKI